MDKLLDADEAIALGSSKLSANLSDRIELNRKLGMIDGSCYGFLVELIGSDLVKDEGTKFLLVPRMKKMPIKLFRSIKHNEDFVVSLSYESAYELPPGSPMDIQDGKKESLNTDNETNSSDVSAEVKDNLRAETEKVLKKRTFKVPLKIVEKPIGPGALSKEMLFEVKTRIEELHKKDLERRRAVELKNSLEEYIYST